MKTLTSIVLLSLSLGVFADENDNLPNVLSYDAWLSSDNRLKCMYGYFAGKTGDHDSAKIIYEDCIRRWDDVYSMIGLAHIYENGNGVPVDFKRATDLMRRGANTRDEAGYSSLARYHYGVALFEGKGVDRNLTESRYWLQLALNEGVSDAARYLEQFPDPDSHVSGTD